MHYQKMQYFVFIIRSVGWTPLSHFLYKELFNLLLSQIHVVIVNKRLPPDFNHGASWLYLSD